MLRLKVGDRVVHRFHGSGVITVIYEYKDSALVLFDKELKGCGSRDLEVSLGMLRSDAKKYESR